MELPQRIGEPISSTDSSFVSPSGRYKRPAIAKHSNDRDALELAAKALKGQ